MRFVIHLLMAMTLALAVGFGLSFYALNDGRLFGAFRVGPWAAWPQAGAAEPDPYTRAMLARQGILQLGLSEGLQFIATTDSSGRPLDRACRYGIDGRTPVATFWTLTALDATGVNIARPDGQVALTSTRLARGNDGSPRITVSRTLAPYNWLEITGEGPFSLALTFYDMASLSGLGASVSSLPAITREACS